eukprot:gb/GECG01004349.1/.p1 GENE.gb/GECG01004349.1/~~gb/GECG01004349.1/.p1  ORF type:complete len:249 (+),score=55.06 gb/GECG01004349.1/:1-747(+)
MARKVATLGDLNKDNEDNNRYVGGQGEHGGGSGLAVEPSADENRDARRRMNDILKKESQESTGETSNSKKITFWKNGFTVDNGPLRTGDTDADKKFMSDIEKGYVPSELREEAEGGVVEVDVEDKRGEEYVPPAYVAYGGTGQAVGASSAAPSSAVVQGGAASSSSATVDDSQPTTKIQYRLTNGKKATATFNLNHTVRDVQAYARTVNPDVTSFVLTAGFPPKPLDNPDLTIEEAGLKNAAVTQKKA